MEKKERREEIFFKQDVKEKNKSKKQKIQMKEEENIFGVRIGGKKRRLKEHSLYKKRRKMNDNNFRQKQHFLHD